MSGRLPIVELGSGAAHGDPGRVRPELARARAAALDEELATLVPNGVLVAFSGGVDSAFLLHAAAKVASARGGGRVVALTTVSPSLPRHDRLDAEAFTATLGVRHLWREGGEVDLPAYVRNDHDRCYHCKTELFRIAREAAEAEGLGSILYGYNASDRGDVRPGHQAALENGILSPLADAGLEKTDIRFLMEEAGIALGSKPSSPCLSSRVMTGIPITHGRLEDVARMEEILRTAGATVFRVRVCREEGGALFLRVEAEPDEMTIVLACREELSRMGASLGYRWVTLDLGGYRMGGGTG